MIELLLPKVPFSGPFCTFLKEQTSYRAVNKDQWMSLLEFCKTTDSDLNNYDENGSCTQKTLVPLLSVSHSQQGQ